MKLNNFELKETDAPNGVQVLLDFGKYELSIVRSDYTYGGKQGKFEIGVFEGNTMVELPGITKQGDTVKGWLTETEVDAIILKMIAVTGKDPVQI